MAMFTTRPVIMGRRGVVTSGHYLATAAGFRIMEQGGNAVDAAASMAFCLNLLEPHMNGIGGEVPTLIYSARDRKAFAISGMGWSPEAFTISWCRDRGIDLVPGDGYLPACVPASVDTWAVAVSRFGTKSFSEILQPAIELANDGFPLYEALREHLDADARFFLERYPTTAAIYCPGGRVPEVGELIRNPDWAATLELMCDAERSAEKRGRVAGIEAARDVFYKGEIAERIVDFVTRHPVLDATGEAHAGLISYEDLSEWRAGVEAPVSFRFRGLDVHKCSSWTQGPVFLQQLALLDGFDIGGMGHNSVDYIHTLMECAKLAFADREAYYGDPAFDAVPFDVLLSPSYNSDRRRRVGPRASLKMRPGDVGDGGTGLRDRRRRGGQSESAGIGGQVRPRPVCQERKSGRYDAPRRGRFRGEHGCGHAERRMDQVFSRHPGVGFPSGHPRPDVLPEPRPAERPGASQASKGDAYANAGHASGPPLHGVRHARRRYARPDHAPVLPEL